MRIRLTMFRLITVSLTLLLAGASGCIDSGRFDAHMRARCFDVLWARLERDYVYFEVHEHLDELRQQHRQAVVTAPTRRAYLIAMANLLAELDDPHVQFRN
ncbi:MAG: hypothetical protein JXO22_00825, partial [Phycisphaerae bacterium]|nr:hypothetical protein [Phycisphaerae bacterium]